jgi:hypothetical protein
VTPPDTPPLDRYNRYNGLPKPKVCNTCNACNAPDGGVPRSAAARLSIPDAVLTRSDLAELGYSRRAIDAIFRACPVERWPGFDRPMVRVSSFLEWRERCTAPADCDVDRTLRAAPP